MERRDGVEGRLERVRGWIEGEFVSLSLLGCGNAMDKPMGYCFRLVNYARKEKTPSIKTTVPDIMSPSFLHAHISYSQLGLRQNLLESMKM